jgi:Na+-transporting NADH:ubiquinone oxidoreductase subunit B
MLRKFLDYQLSLVSEGKPLNKLKPLVTAADTFFYEPPINTKKAPHIRDAVDLKRWMSMVVFALMPCILWAIWNTGLQKLVFVSGDYTLMNEYLQASTSFSGYADFVMKNNRYLDILLLGAQAFLPLVFISYAVGGLWEGLFACIRRHEIAEGFLVTGILYPLILPPTIPYWMAAIGVSAGVVIGKELFGGTGMNILNPALTARCFLFFTFPNKMSGDVWVGTNSVEVASSLSKMNESANLEPIDAYTAASGATQFNISTDIKRVHIDAIASNNLQDQVGSYDVIKRQFSYWSQNYEGTLGELSAREMKSFVTCPIPEGGLGLPLEHYDSAHTFSSLNYGIGHYDDATLFFGNHIGCMGETSVFACLIGALMLINCGVGSFRTMAAMGLGTFLSAWLFQFCSQNFGFDQGAWNPAKFAFPAYKHLLLGGFAFGLVFMSTDPVSAPGMNLSKWIYGLTIGIIVTIIRIINPAFPEGVMLAILLGNVAAPLIDYYAVRYYRRRPRVCI